MRAPKTASEFLRLGAANANHFYHFRDLSRLELLITPALRRPSRREKVLSCSPGSSLCASPLHARAGPNTQRLYSTALSSISLCTPIPSLASIPFPLPSFSERVVPAAATRLSRYEPTLSPLLRDQLPVGHGHPVVLQLHGAPSFGWGCCLRLRRSFLLRRQFGCGLLYNLPPPRQIVVE